MKYGVENTSRMIAKEKYKRISYMLSLLYYHLTQYVIYFKYLINIHLIYKTL